MPLPCRQVSAVLQTDSRSAVLVGVRCKSWTCEYCAPINRRNLVRRLRSVTASTFITLTANPASFASPLDAYRHMSVALNHLVKRIRRRYGKHSFSYFAVWEQTRKGWPHLHIIATCPFIPHAYISLVWRQLTGSYIVDIRRVKSQKEVQKYLTKYLTKSLVVPHGMKRHRSSRGYLQPPAPPLLAPFFPQAGWAKATTPPTYLSSYLASQNYSVHAMNPNLWILTFTTAPNAPPFWLSDLPAEDLDQWHASLQAP